MESDASDVLGAQEIAGALVNPRGSPKKMTASVAGTVTCAVAGAFAAGLAAGLPHERSEIASTELASGVAWKFGVPEACGNAAKGLVERLGGRIV